MEFLKEIERNHLDVYGIEIMQNGNLIFKKSFTPDIRYPIYSATKSFTSTAIGIASDEGKISIYEPLSNYLEKNYLKNMNLNTYNDFCKIPIERFLKMSVHGYPFRPSGDDWLKNIFQYNIKYAESEKFSYTNISAYLVGIVCENAVGCNLMNYLKTHLFDPFEINYPIIYQKDPQGRFYGSTGMYLSVHKLSLLGQLYLQKGVFNNNHIISEKWVNEATKIKIDNGNEKYGYFSG